MFPIELFGVKRTLGRLKKYLQKVCLISWITIIKILKDYLPLRV
jgi:hypothetical protein